MTRGELRTRVLRALDDDPVAPVYWQAPEIDRYLDEAHEVAAETAPIVRRTFAVPCRPGTQVYQLPGLGEDILVPYRVWLPDRKRRLRAVTLAWLDLGQIRWLETQGDPWCWFPVSWDQFGLWPTPGSGTGVMEISCYVWPAPFADDQDEPEFLPSRHPHLIPYGKWLGHLKQWRGKEAAEALQEFFTAASALRAATGVEEIREQFFPRTERGTDR